MQLVLSIGPALNPKHIDSLPPNCVVMNYAPQVELLKRSALCITHAGLNTVLESLTPGVPMVAIPITSDQPGVAARIAHTNIGAYVSFQEMTSPRLSTLVDQVLSNSEYRENSGKMKQAIAESRGLERAADLFEQAFHLDSRSCLTTRLFLTPAMRTHSNLVLRKCTR